METSNRLTKATLGLVSGVVVSCHKVEDEPENEDPYDLLCDSKQGAQLSKAVDGISSNLDKIAQRISRQCEDDIRFCPPDDFNIGSLDRSTLTTYPFLCLGESYSMANAGAITMEVPPSNAIVVAFTPTALDESVTTSAALSGVIAHEFGHLISQQALNHTDIYISANEAPVDWIYALGHATEFVCDGVDSATKQSDFLRDLKHEGNDVPYIGLQLQRLRVSRSRMVEAEGRLGCATSNTMHMIHVCSIFNQRIASISETIGEYEASLSTIQIK